MVVRPGAMLRHLVHRLQGVPTLPSVRAGVVGAAVAVAGSYARGLLPRSAADQAIATGVVVSAHYLVTASAAAAAETLALYSSGDHGVHGRRPPVTSQLAVDLSFVTAGLVVDRALPPDPDEPMQRSLGRFVAHFAMMGGAADILVRAADELLELIPATRKWPNRPLIVDAGLGAGLATLAVFSRHHRAKHFGLIDPDRPAVERSTLKETAKALGVGTFAGVGLLAVAGTEQIIARRTSELLHHRVGPVEFGSPWIGHVVAIGLIGGAGLAGLVLVKRNVERKGDVVEAAYPEPPTSEFVTAGPRSEVPFDKIGKEGRRFVLMALTPEEITGVTGQPAVAPIRIVAGYEAAADTAARAELCLQEMDRLGAFDRSIICVASPTGVGYVSYVFAETLEYLTGGDCAIVMPQYALVPSALALADTGDGAQLQRLVLEGIRERVSKMPPDRRPRVVQFGESLGAQVALDIAYPAGTGEFDDLGVDAGLYLGVPFRTMTWNTWIQHRDEFDPAASMLAVSDPRLLADLDGERRERVRHLMVVHHDDPVNKFGYRLVVRPPWWMGRPDTRPPKVPREVLWRPITTFVLTLIDLKNGMNFRPGTFERRGHDYRIDTVDGVVEAFRLESSDELRDAIGVALRKREVDWAKRRLVARKFAAARDSVNSTLRRWGVNVDTLDSLPDVSLESLLDSAQIANEPMDLLVADHDPNAVSDVPPTPLPHV